MQGQIDPYPILDKGVPQSVDFIESAAALAIAMDIQLEIRLPDCPPFLYEFGLRRSNRHLLFRIRDSLLTDLNDVGISIPCYATPDCNAAVQHERTRAKRYTTRHPVRDSGGSR